MLCDNKLTLLIGVTVSKKKNNAKWLENLRETLRNDSTDHAAYWNASFSFSR